MNERLEEEMNELESAEDFLEYFGLDFDAKVVHVNRLHILHRFHSYMSEAAAELPESYAAQRSLYAGLLARAYQDFVTSDAITEKVFKVFQMHQPRSVEVGFDGLLR